MSKKSRVTEKMQRMRLRSAIRLFIEYPALDNLLRIADETVDAMPCLTAGRPIWPPVPTDRCPYCPLGQVINNDAVILHSCPISRYTRQQMEYIWENYSGLLVIAMIQFAEGFEDEG